MRMGDLTTGAAKLRLSLESLDIVWSEVREQWRDANAKQFEETYLMVVRPKVKGTMEAMARLANVLAKAYQECEDEQLL
jgi:hypothetical protein